MRGYYSLIQYCPDPTKAEVANVGVVLLCPEKRFLDVRVANGNDKVRRFFGVHGHGLDRIDSMKEAIRERLAIDHERLGTLEAFQQFIATRGNKLILTEPRNMRVENPHDDLWRLFKELVGGRAMGEHIERAERGVSVRSLLKQVFARPELELKIDLQVSVTPKYGRPFIAPYAYYNGKNNYITPQIIHVDRDKTLGEAERFAVRGRQLHKHGLDGRKAELIVPLPEPSNHLGDITRDVMGLLRDNDVRTVLAGQIDELAQEIEREGHLIHA